MLFMKTRVKVGLVQTSCSANLEDNMKKAIAGIRQAAAQGAQIVCLQELFRSLYFCDQENYDHFNLAEKIPESASLRELQKISKDLKIVLIASLFEKRTEGIYHNTTAVIDADGEYLGAYRKQHIPDDPSYYEKFYFTPGDGGYRVFETKFAKIGVLICWDQWFPEAARITALKGAEILFYPTAIGWASDQDEQTNKEQYDAWQTIQRAHSIANGVPVVSVNRTGREGQMQFWGGSFVSNAFGKLLFQAPHLEEITHVQELDLADADRYRTHWPFLRDRRIDTYEPILNRFLDSPLK